jgi:release factor glutamine methyltransferase
MKRAEAPAPGATYRDLLDAGARRLTSARGSAREDPRGEARRLLATASSSDASDMLLHADDPAPWPVRVRFSELLARRASGVPLQLLAGEIGFHDVTLSVQSGVFLPRPETELLVEEARRALDALRRREPDRAARVVDLCTGSGAVAVALAAAERGQETHVYAGDVDPHAIRLARVNASRCHVTVDVRRSDLFAAFLELRGETDIVVSNPPYVAPAELHQLAPEVAEFDPPRALFDPEGGTGFHRRIARAAGDFLRVGGMLLMEIGATQGAEVRALLRGMGYDQVGVLPDLAGRDRIARATWRGAAWTPSS